MNEINITESEPTVRPDRTSCLSVSSRGLLVKASKLASSYL